MSKTSKRYIAAFAALQILLYHCWIPVFQYGSALGDVERFLLTTTYVGVDLFFFISAYTLSANPVTNYLSFIKNRAIKLLPLFVLAFAFGKFLWFIPSVMLMYLVFPPLYKICVKRPALSFVLLFIGWAGLCYIVLTVINPLQSLGIFLFRIPSIILGAYAVELDGKLSEKAKLILGCVLLLIGLVTIYKFGYMDRISLPFKDVFYLTGIPEMLGIILLIDSIAEKVRIPAVETFGGMTLEIYFTQMFIGVGLINFVYSVVGIKLVTNIITLAIITIISFCIHKVYKLYETKT